MLVRDYIISYKQEIKEKQPELMSSDLYQKPLPPQVNQNYMARPDEIREHAKQTLEAYESDPFYLYLQGHRDQLDPKEIDKTCIDNVLNYAGSLKAAIQKDDLVTMRRHERGDSYIESFHSCAKKVKETLDDAEPNLFALVAAAEDSYMNFPSEDNAQNGQSMSL